MQKHEWKEETDEGRRYYRALHHAGRWSFSTTLETDYEWEEGIDAPQELWQKLRDVLWAKYQRRRCTWKILVTVDKVLKKEFGVDPPQSN